MTGRLVQTLLRRAAAEPGRLALAAGDEELTWGELGARVRGTARRLAADGVGPGDRVVLAASTSAAFVCGYFATHLLRAIALPVDPRIPAGRLGYIADQVEPKAIHLARSLELPGRTVRDIEELGRAEDAWRDETPDETADADPEDVADVLFTSGTTGRPKGVILSHRAIRSAAANINAFIGNGPDDREVVPLPLSHSFGLGRLRCQVLAGGAIVLFDGFTAAGALLETIRSRNATGFVFVPAGLAVLFRTTGDALGELADTLKWVEIGSAAMPGEDKRRLMRLLPRTRLCMHYGLTEASRSAFTELHAAGERLASIGRPTPGVEIRVVDGAGRPVPDGTRGRLVVRSRACMSGYWNDPQATAAAFVDDFLVTGDVGRREGDGYLYLEAREKDLINVGGREVSPVEIERILEEHEAVAACACVGIPDPQGITGSAVKAYLVPVSKDAPPPKPIELVKLLRGRIEPYKMPVAFEWIDDLPRTSSGKLQRGLLAAG
jgi:acyl-CoA synthetase (AMP-forming)/AMP-acid ligase II